MSRASYASKVTQAASTAPPTTDKAPQNADTAVASAEVDMTAANKTILERLLIAMPEVVLVDEHGRAVKELTLLTISSFGAPPIQHAPVNIDPQVLKILNKYTPILCNMCLSFHNVIHDEEGTLTGILCQSCRSKISNDEKFACPGRAKSFYCNQTRWVDAMGEISEMCSSCHKHRMLAAAKTDACPGCKNLAKCADCRKQRNNSRRQRKPIPAK